MDLPSKLPDTEVTIFSVMTALANRHGAINLSQGFPDFDPAPELIDRVAHYMRKGCNQYAPMQGVPLLRERIADKVKALYGAVYDPLDEITVTTGATEALFAVISAAVHPGDEVLIVEPAFDAYVPAVRLCGGIPVYVKLHHPDYRLDWDEVGRAMGPRTRLMVLNSPHNPCGAVLAAEDLRELARLVRGTDLLILSDEVYEHIVFDGRRHESLGGHPELAERSFVISSFGKTYHTTGWKVGYCLAPRALSRELCKIHQYLTFAVNTPIQHAYADILADRQRYLGLAAFYQRKRDFFLEAVRGSRFKPLPCGGTYFQLLDYGAISEEPDTVFARRLTENHGVAAIPPSVFSHDREDHRVLRFCFAKGDDTLRKAGERLCRI
jgi:methionine aminotransferase